MSSEQSKSSKTVYNSIAPERVEGSHSTDRGLIVSIMCFCTSTSEFSPTVNFAH